MLLKRLLHLVLSSWIEQLYSMQLLVLPYRRICLCHHAKADSRGGNAMFLTVFLARFIIAEVFVEIL